MKAKLDKHDRDSIKRTSEDRRADGGQWTYDSAESLLGRGIMRRNPAVCSNEWQFSHDNFPVGGKCVRGRANAPHFVANRSNDAHNGVRE